MLAWALHILDDARAARSAVRSVTISQLPTSTDNDTIIRTPDPSAAATVQMLTLSAAQGQPVSPPSSPVHDESTFKIDPAKSPYRRRRFSWSRIRTGAPDNDSDEGEDMWVVISDRVSDGEEGREQYLVDLDLSVDDEMGTDDRSTKDEEGGADGANTKDSSMVSTHQVREQDDDDTPPLTPVIPPTLCKFTHHRTQTPHQATDSPNPPNSDNDDPKNAFTYMTFNTLALSSISSSLNRMAVFASTPLRSGLSTHPVLLDLRRREIAMRKTTAQSRREHRNNARGCGSRLDRCGSRYMAVMTMR
ncbi:hypothetical protein DFS34DRAFT_646510 [Phlyctochytrium arcticum]|nr:hypothetical protein DFS34DRAFT_646510 [Phlyctochytrium arcticum]